MLREIEEKNDKSISRLYSTMFRLEYCNKMSITLCRCCFCVLELREKINSNYTYRQ
jgi:hypothetical protein